MGANSTIKVNTKTKEELDKIKNHPRETYNDLLERLIKERKITIT